MSASSTAPDLMQARQFLYVLAPDTSARFAFRTFDDRDDDIRLATKCHGTLDQGIRQSGSKKGNSCHPSSFLGWMNDLGAGVFVMVNETDGMGQGEGNVVRVRALFVDCDDDLSLVNLYRFITATELLPTIVVASGGLTASGADKLQVYWTVKDCPLEQFKPAQLTLIVRIGSDPSVHDLPRVMRLPGCWHHKKQPRMTRLLSVDPGRVYDFASFITTVKCQPIVAKVSTAKRTRSGAPTPINGLGPPSNSMMNARMRELLRQHGGLVLPAIGALISEAVGPTNGPGNRHETLKTAVGKLGSRAWSADEITAFVLPRINQQWGDGDWSEHLASVVSWATGRDAARGAELARAFGHKQ